MFYVHEIQIKMPIIHLFTQISYIFHELNQTKLHNSLNLLFLLEIAF